MAELSLDGSNPDVSLLRDINGLAEHAPGWVDGVMEFVGEYGLVVLMVLIAGWCWWRVARRRGAEAPAAVAGVLWAGLAAAIALALNVPLRNFVDRPRPFVDHKGIDVLVEGKTDFSFVSDHATLTMAVAMGLFMVSRRWGLAAVAVALAEGFCRVYMGVHYPTDVLGGFALGTAVALLLAPAALALLTPLVKAVADSRLAVLVRAAPGRAEGRRGGEPYPEPSAVDRDLAA